MDYKRWIKGTTLLCVMAALTLVGCGSDDAAPTAKTPASATAVPVATTAPVPTAAPTGPQGKLDIALVDLGTERWIPRMMGPEEVVFWDMLLDPIIGMSRKDGFTHDLSLGLAESWNMVETGDKIDLTLNLRKGVKYHNNNGTVKASDLKFAWGQIMREGGIYFAAGDFKKAIGNDITKLEVEDELTLIVHTDKKTAPAGFERNTLGGQRFQGLYPEEYFKNLGGEEEFKKAPVGSGPFKFIKHTPSQSVEFEAVADHWLQTSDFAKVTFHKVPEPATQIAQLLAGQVHIVSLTPRQVKEIGNAKNVNIVKIDGGGEVFVNFGGMVLKELDGYDATSPWTGPELTGKKPTAIRKALNLAIDREAILTKLLSNEGRITSMPFFYDQPNTPWHGGWTTHKYDPVAAKAAMAEGGYPDGFTMKAFIYPLAYGPTNGDVMEAVLGMWEKHLGIKAERIVTEYRPTVRTRLVDRTTAGYMYTYTQGSVNDPYTYFSGACCFLSSAVLGHWEIPEVDKLVWAAEKEYDEAKRWALMKQVGDFIYDNYIGASIAQINIMWGVNSDTVASWTPTPGSGNLRDVAYIKRLA